jgi:hypothetical protein
MSSSKSGRRRAPLCKDKTEDPVTFGVQPSGAYLPTPSEIQRICTEIQTDWSAADRNRGLTVPKQSFLIPEIATVDSAFALTAI